MAVLLIGIALVLLVGHDPSAPPRPLLAGVLQIVAGVVAGFVIGLVASLLGVAGGELLIPTLVLLFGAEIKLAGSLSLALSLPTMLVGFARYSRDESFSVLSRHKNFVPIMAVGSMAGAYLGGLLLGIVPGVVLLQLVALILVVSAVKVWQQSLKSPILGRTVPSLPFTQRPLAS